MTAQQPQPTVTARAIARALGRPEPTDEQVRVIETPPQQTTLVIAGAGSGKTETMANRVLWLVANGHAAAHEILGLTFTRKAAGELSERMNERLEQLARAGLMPPTETELPDTPTVATYNSFASSLVGERAMLIGREPGAAVLDDSAAWQIARQLVTSSDDERLSSLDMGVNSLTETVLSLERALRENIRTTDEVQAVVTDFLRLRELPFSDTPQKRTPYASVTKATAHVESLGPLLALVDRYSAEKRRRGVLEFSDQVALALEICRRSPATVADYRARHRFVLLDEYQDTSVVQTWFLAHLFRGQPVMAVGDPNQSIYGWRGASAENLKQFAVQFTNQPPHVLSLLTSWRNASDILTAANTIVAPLNAQSATGAATVERLAPRPGAPIGEVRAVVCETIAEEAAAVADWIRTQRSSAGQPVTAAVLFRNRAAMTVFAEALTAASVPNRILGIGGLLSSPEIADIIAMMRCMWFSDANSALIKVLSGPRWRVGVKDLAGLAAAAAWLGRHDEQMQPLSDEEVTQKRRSGHPEDQVSLIDALDALATAPDGHPMLAGVSELGLQRFRAAAQSISRLRLRSHHALPDILRAIERELLLDLELQAVHGANGSANARRNIDAFVDLMQQFLAVDEHGTLASFLAWLEHAELKDAHAAPQEAPDPETVQLITVHGSKGLEWDVVAIPRLLEKEFPGETRTGDGWLRFGQLPDELKGDAGALPPLDWRGVQTQKEFNEAFATYREHLKEYQALEERRIMYVALTRARNALHLSASFWAHQKEPRQLSRYLTELVAEGCLPELPTVSAHDTRPESTESTQMQWPIDPLGQRSSVVTLAAERVRQAATLVSTDADAALASLPETLRDTVALLLEERERNAHAHTAALQQPRSLNASGLKDFIADPLRVQRERRRPMPQKPFVKTRLGTLFHEWVQQRYGTPLGGMLALPNLDVTSALPDALAADLAELQRSFEQSRWARLQPIAVEQDIRIHFLGSTIICKIDAIYCHETPDGPRYEIVDWKTGVAPRTESERQERQLQLALYKIAYTEYTGIDPDHVSATLYYVAADETITAQTLPDRAELEQLWQDRVLAGGSVWRQ